MLLALGILGYIVVFTAAAWYKYDTYQMGFDLGVHEQVLWNTAHGRIAATSAFAHTESYLGIDIIPTELLLAPIYALAPSAYTMLFLQTLVLALGAVPVFLIARDRFRQSQISDFRLQIGQQRDPQPPISNLQSPIPNWAGLAFAAAFLLYHPVEYMNLYEFQIRAFATTFLLCAFYALERRRFLPFLLWALLALGCRSEAGLVLAGMGVAQLRIENVKLRNDAGHSQFSILNSQFLLFAVLPIALGLGWFVLCLQVLIPYFRNGEPSLYLSVIYGQIDGRPWLGDSPGAIFRTLLTRPGFVLQEVFGHATRGPMRLRYLLEMFLPFGFLLLLQPRLLLITLPIFALNLLSNTPNIHASTHYHYQALIIPFMVVGSAYGLQRLLDRLRAGAGRRAAALGGMVALSLLCSVWFGNPLERPVNNYVKGTIDNARIAVIERMLARVPLDAPLTTSVMIGPHAARREGIFFFPGNVIYPEAKIWSGQYMLLDEDELLATADEQRRQQRRQLLAELEARGYRLLDKERGVSLWQRG